MFCDYHPQKRAVWYCPSCDLDFCESCVEVRVVEQYGKKKKIYFCPKCDTKAQRHSAENTIVPFWNMLPKFFLYPFHLRILVLMTVLSFSGVLFSKGGLFSFLMRVAIWGVLVKYSFAVLKYTAKGSLRPPKIDQETISNEFGIVFKQVGIYLAIGYAGIKITQIAGVSMGVVFGGLAILSIPSMIIVLVATNSLVHALNPILFVSMALRIGWGYLLMFLFYTLLGSAPWILGQYIISYIPAQLQFFLFSMAKSYYIIISYHLMGYVVYQYHEEIGYEVEFEEEDSTAREGASEDDPQERLMERTNMLVKDGNLDEAIQMIKEETKGHLSNIALSERYYGLLKMRERTSEMLEHAKSYLDLLAREDRKDRLCDIYRECVSHDTKFAPGPSTTFKIAGCLNEGGKHKEAIQAYDRFVKANSDHPMIPKAYFLAANIVNEKLNNPQKASDLLRGILKKYPNHEMIPYVERYLKQIDFVSVSS